jgi:hypothetical protein
MSYMSFGQWKNSIYTIRLIQMQEQKTEELERKLKSLEDELLTVNRIKDAFSAGHGILLSG